MSAPIEADGVEPTGAVAETAPTEADAPVNETAASANPEDDGTHPPPPAVRTRVRDVLARARIEEGVATLASHLHGRLMAALRHVDDDLVRHSELEHLIPLEAAMALDAVLSDTAAHARARAERLLDLSVDGANPAVTQMIDTAIPGATDEDPTVRADPAHGTPAGPSAPVEPELQQP